MALSLCTRPSQSFCCTSLGVEPLLSPQDLWMSDNALGYTAAVGFCTSRSTVQPYGQEGKTACLCAGCWKGELSHVNECRVSHDIMGCRLLPISLGFNVISCSICCNAAQIPRDALQLRNIWLTTTAPLTSDKTSSSCLVVRVALWLLISHHAQRPEGVRVHDANLLFLGY